MNGAISSIGASTFDEGAVSAAADTVDRGFYPRYAAAGLSDFFNVWSNRARSDGDRTHLFNTSFIYTLPVV